MLCNGGMQTLWPELLSGINCRMRTAGLFLALALTTTTVGCNEASPTYSAACSTPLSKWGTEKIGIGHLVPVMPVYIGSDGTILWGKNAISDAQLRKYMMDVSGLNPVPQVVLEVSPSTSCDRVRAIRSIMDAAPICKGRYSRCSEGWNWKEWPITGGP